MPGRAKARGQRAVVRERSDEDACHRFVVLAAAMIRHRILPAHLASRPAIPPRRALQQRPAARRPRSAAAAAAALPRPRQGASPVRQAAAADRGAARPPRHPVHARVDARGGARSVDAEALRRARALRQPRRRSRRTRSRRCSTSSRAAGGSSPSTAPRSCFPNSPRYIALVGGQFQQPRHRRVRRRRSSTPDHPVMKGLKPFHDLGRDLRPHQAQRRRPHVLQSASTGDGREPWTWVRTQGKGRVFYTAYGHDERTWGNPGFQTSMQQRHRCGRSTTRRGAALAAARRCRRSTTSTASTCPNYEKPRSGRRSTSCRSTAAESMKFIQVAGRVRGRALRAASRMIVQADHDAPSTSAAGSGSPRPSTIPTTCSAAGQGDDRIKILEDTDGDGRPTSSPSSPTT